MIFKLHSAFALGLIAMVAGTYLIARMRSADMCCKGFAKFVGWFTIITAFLGLICITYHGVMYGSQGAYGLGKRWHGKPMKYHCPLMEKSLEAKPEPSEAE